MTKGLKITFISIGVIGTGIGIWYLFFKNKTGNETPDVKDKSIQEKKNHTSKNSNSYKSEGDPLKLYSNGKNVECLQRALNVKGCLDKNGSGLTVDGKFGPLTESSLTACGYGKSISLAALKSMVQAELNKGNTINCTGSCCAGLTAKETNDNISTVGDWDNDGIPDTIDRDIQPNDSIFSPNVPPIPVDNTYVYEIPYYAGGTGQNVGFSGSSYQGITNGFTN